MIHPLSAPSARDASRILSSVPYRDRLLVGYMRWPSGFMSAPVRSLHELHAGLAASSKTIPALHVPTAARWVRDVVGDPELAAAMDACGCDEAVCFSDRCERLRELIGARLEQLRGIAGDEIQARVRPPAGPIEA